jgi:hypothetical protein
MVNVQSTVGIGVGWVPSTAYVQAKDKQPVYLHRTQS